MIAYFFARFSSVIVSYIDACCNLISSSVNVFKLADFVIFFFILLAASTRIHDTLDSDFFMAMSSSDSDVATSDLSLAACELDERLQEPPSTPPAFETTAGAGKGKGKGKGKSGKKAVEGQLTEDQKQDAIDFLRERPYIYNRSHSDYKDAAKRNREWTEFADQLGVPVAVITSWYRCMRAMLGRAKKAKTKSGSADVCLPRAQEHVWTHMQCLVPYISQISSDTVGPKKRKTTAEPDELTESEAEFDPDQPAPSWMVPGYAGIHAAICT